MAVNRIERSSNYFEDCFKNSFKLEDYAKANGMLVYAVAVQAWKDLKAEKKLDLDGYIKTSQKRGFYEKLDFSQTENELSPGSRTI